MKSLLERLTPSTILGLLAAIFSCAAAFGLPLTAAQQASVLVFGGALSVTLLAHGLSGALTNLSPQSVMGLVTATIGTAIAFGAPITQAQSESILTLAGLIAGLLLVHGVVLTAAASRRSPVATPYEGGKISVSPDGKNVYVSMARRFKGGRLPAFCPPALKTFLEYATKLAKPPASFKAPKAAYPMDGNDRYGDCTIAGVAHLDVGWDKLFARNDSLPTEQAIVAEYFKLTGGQDTGLVEANVLSTWRKIGLFGSKIWGYAPVKTSDATAIKQAIAFYGGCYLGIQCPESAQRQFSEGKPWTYEGEQTEDGHCIVALGYDSKGNLECATWGQIVKVTPGFLAHYLDEAWVILSHQLVEAGKDTLGLNLPLLEADLAGV